MNYCGADLETRIRMNIFVLFAFERGTFDAKRKFARISGRRCSYADPRICINIDGLADTIY